MKMRVTKEWIDGLVDIVDEVPSHRLVMQMIRNEMPATVGQLQEIEQIGEMWYLLGRAWKNICDAEQNYSPYFILNAWEDLKTVVETLKSALKNKQAFFTFTITKDNFDDKVAEKIKELCYLVLSYVYEWED